ncbi:hypothetical protein V2G26_011380 [Clonostachys chloroleuca]
MDKGLGNKPLPCDRTRRWRTIYSASCCLPIVRLFSSLSSLFPIIHTIPDLISKLIRPFKPPRNTLAGDAAITIIIQCLINRLIESILITTDLAKQVIPPHHWLFLLDEPPPLKFFSNPFIQALRDFRIALLSFTLF